MRFLEKLQKLPLSARKKIVFGAVIVSGIVLFYFWFQRLSQQIEKIRQQNYQQLLPPLPEIQLPTTLSPEKIFPTSVTYTYPYNPLNFITITTP